MLYISFLTPASIIVITASAVSLACNQLRIGVPSLCNGIFYSNERYLIDLGINFSTY
jgi:hypothetical protein